MTKITRSDIFMRSEQGGAWFEDFLRVMAGQPTQTQSILDAINQKKGETVESVVSKYREAVGLDAFADDGSEEEINKAASAPVRPISIRHAHMLADDDKKDEEDKKGEEESVVVIIEGDPGLKADLESILEGSGGNKNTHAIINFLREMLGDDLVSYSDDALVEYIDSMKNKYMMNTVDSEPRGQVGRVGTEDITEYDDHVADFVEHGKGS